MGNFDQKVNKFIEIFWEQNGYNKVLQGLQNTLMIAIAGLIIGIIIGTIIATVRVLPKYKTLPKVLNAICKVYLSIIRGTPTMVQVLIFNFVIFASIAVNEVIVGGVAFGINSGAYVAEIVRSGIMSIDKGQMEAGRSLGLSSGQTMKLIIMPQAFKNVLPALINEMIVLLK